MMPLASIYKYFLYDSFTTLYVVLGALYKQIVKEKCALKMADAIWWAAHDGFAWRLLFQSILYIILCKTFSFIKSIHFVALYVLDDFLVSLLLVDYLYCNHLSGIFLCIMIKTNTYNLTAQLQNQATWSKSYVTICYAGPFFPLLSKYDIIIHHNVWLYMRTNLSDTALLLTRFKSRHKMSHSLLKTLKDFKMLNHCEFS